MRWYINDLSLQEQYASEEEFFEEMRLLFRLRRWNFIREGLYCSGIELRKRLVYGNATLELALRNSSQRDFRNLVIQWLDKFGPFLETDRQFEEEDYFEYLQFDVTNQGLGEAARRVKARQQAEVFSFAGGEIDFQQNTLEVRHGLTEAPFGVVRVMNAYGLKQFKARAIDMAPKAATYADLLAQCRGRFDRLVLSDAIERQLRTETFYETVRDATLDLLSVLQEFMENRLPGGRVTARGAEILQQYFVGENAWFSDESQANKKAFKDEMTFSDPDDRRREIVCFWHGKIQTPQFRIHFQWPVPTGATLLKVLYIGPKISKK